MVKKLLRILFIVIFFVNAILVVPAMAYNYSSHSELHCKKEKAEISKLKGQIEILKKQVKVLELANE